MKFAAVMKYANHEQVTKVRPAHREYLTSLKQQGKLWMAGPFVDDSGALIIYETDSEDEARQIIKADPFFKAGGFASFDLNEWRQVF